MAAEHNSGTGSHQDHGEKTKPLADQIGDHDPQKVEKLARAGEDTGAVEQEE